MIASAHQQPRKISEVETQIFNFHQDVENISEDNDHQFLLQNAALRKTSCPATFNNYYTYKSSNQKIQKRSEVDAPEQSLSTLEEQHRLNAINYGAMNSERMKGRRERKKSFEKQRYYKGDNELKANIKRSRCGKEDMILKEDGT